MEFILEFIFDLVFESSMEIAKDKKIKKWIRYPLSNGSTVKFLNNDDIYLGNQVECEFNDGELIRYFGLVANMDFLLVSEYGTNGENPEIILYKKR